MEGEPKLILTPAHPFSPRQGVILEMRGNGFRYKEVAREEYISRETVKNHVSEAFDKVEALTGERPVKDNWIGCFVRNRLLIIEEQE